MEDISDNTVYCLATNTGLTNNDIGRNEIEKVFDRYIKKMSTILISLSLSQFYLLNL